MQKKKWWPAVIVVVVVVAAAGHQEKKIRLIKKTNRQEMPDAMGFKNSKDFLVLHLQSDQG